MNFANTQVDHAALTNTRGTSELDVTGLPHQLHGPAHQQTLDRYTFKEVLAELHMGRTCAGDTRWALYAPHLFVRENDELTRT